MGKHITQSKKGNTLTVGLTGNLTSDNVQPVLAEILELSSREPHDQLELDLSDTVYVSSAGLRAFLTLHKKENLVLTGVSSAVYEVLEITGFSRMLDIRRAVRKVSLENAVCIGSGYYSRVYRLDSETIVKLFVTDSAEEDIRRECELDKYAMLMGVPTAISFDLVEAGGKKGIIFEMMNHGTLRDAIRDDPEHMDAHLDKYEQLLRDLHSTADEEKRLPDAKQHLLDSLDLFRELYTEEEFRKIRSLTETVPESDTIIHGDCHVKNIMLHNGEPLLIDLDTLSRGDSVIELGCMFYTYAAFEEFWPGNPAAFLGLEQAGEVFDRILHRYWAGCTEQEFAENYSRIRVIGFIKMLAALMQTRQEEAQAIWFYRDRLLQAVSECETLRMT